LKGIFYPYFYEQIYFLSLNIAEKKIQISGWIFGDLHLVSITELDS
jgi:hypothetical protein